MPWRELGIFVLHRDKLEEIKLIYKNGSKQLFGQQFFT